MSSASWTGVVDRGRGPGGQEHHVCALDRCRRGVHGAYRPVGQTQLPPGSLGEEIAVLAGGAEDADTAEVPHSAQGPQLCPGLQPRADDGDVAGLGQGQGIGSDGGQRARAAGAELLSDDETDEGAGGVPDRDQLVPGNGTGPVGAEPAGSVAQATAGVDVGQVSDGAEVAAGARGRGEVTGGQGEDCSPGRRNEHVRFDGLDVSIGEDSHRTTLSPRHPHCAALGGLTHAGDSMQSAWGPITVVKGSE